MTAAPEHAARARRRLCQAWLASLVLAACGGGDATPSAAAAANSALAQDGPLRRTGRFGSLRDLVFVENSSVGRADGLFVDRFEVTQADWAGFAASEAGRRFGAERVRLVGRGALPAAGMDLFQARAFAAWRFGRLPSEQEWSLVTRGGARNPFPWGRREDATRANTADLALGEAVPVGTFESGRKAGGDTPYDLIGNVREWTETVPHTWCREDGLSVGPSFESCHANATRLPALGTWSVVRGLLPSGSVAVLAGADVPHKVVGADFATPMAAVVAGTSDEQLAGERRQRTGMRVYASPVTLLRRLLQLRDDVPSDAERLQLQRFVRRDAHRAVLQRALEQLPASRARRAGSVADVVLTELERVR